MYCSNCGKKLSPDDYFCSNCGTPVLRQGLFDDDDSDAHEDAFEETRLFTAEELGQYLNDDEELAKAHEVQADTYAQQSTPVAAPETPAEQPAADKAVASAKVAAAEMIGAAGAFAGKFKGKLGAMKAKQAEKKQAQEAARAEKAAQQPDYEEPAPVATSYAEEEDVADTNDAPVSLKKIILPVIVLGLIIGLVIGLVVTQPWSSGSDDTAETTNETTTGVVMMVE